MLRLLRPTVNSLRLVGQLIWVLLNNGWDAVVWGNVRAGSISLAGSPRSFRVLIRLALWAIIGLLIMLLFGDVWRYVSPLLPLLFFTDSLSGIYAPQLFVPVIFGLLSVAWAYLLTGALHTPWPGKLVVLALFALFDLSLTISLVTGLLSEIGLLLSGLGGGPWTLLALLLHTAAWVVLLGVLVWRWRRPVRLGLEFPLMLALTGAMFFSSYLATLLSSRVFQQEAAAGALQLTQTLQLIGVFLMPFLVMAGAEIAEFGMQITRSATGYLGRAERFRQGTGRRLWLAALIFFLLARLAAQWLLPLLRGQAAPWRWGAVIIAGAFLIIFLVARGRVAGSHLPVWVVPVAAVILYGLLIVVQVTGFVQVILAVGLLTLNLDAQALVDLFDRFFAFLTEWNEVLVAMVAGSAGVTVAVDALLRRRRVPAAALYLWVFALWLLWWVFTRAGEALGRLSFDYAHISAVMTPVLLVIVSALLAFRRLSPRALLYLTAAAVLFALLELQSWLSDPLSPLFGLLGAEAALLSVSIFLNVMAAGNRFGLNADSPNFPRASRGLLYFGYALLTVTTVNWLATAHHVSAMSINEQVTRNGYVALGLPLAFWALLVGSRQVLGESALSEDNDPLEP